VTTRSKISRLVERDGDVCHWCGWDFELNDERMRTQDHLIPRSVPGSSNKLENLVLACDLCNWTRGVIPVDEWTGLMAAVRRGEISFELIATIYSPTKRSPREHRRALLPAERVATPKEPKLTQEIGSLDDLIRPKGHR
jgi:hypothetical protein